MLSKKSINAIGFRIGLMKWGLVTWFDWDKTTGTIIRPNFYIYLNMLFGSYLMFLFPISLFLQMYLQQHYREKDENGNDVPFTTSEFVSWVIAWGEVSIAASFTGLNLVVILAWERIIYLLNQLFLYNQRILDMLKTKEIELDIDHMKVIRRGEVLTYLFNFWTIVLPVSLILVVFHPLEPVHIIIKEWLEIDFSPRLELIPWIIILIIALLGATNLLVILAYVAMCTFWISNTVLDDLTPETVHSRNGQRLLLQTKYYGIMEDDEVVQIYRELRLLNVLANDIIGNVWMSIHQVGVLTTAVVLLFFAVKCQHIIIESGLVGVCLVAGSFITPMTVVWYQSTMFGTLADSSNQFRLCGEQHVPRRTLYKRFVRSCQTFYLEEAYPFYKIGRDTFLSFTAQVVDNAVTLLLWQR